MGLPHSGAELIDHPGQGQIYQNGPKSHWHEQGWLEALFDGQVDEQSADDIHHQLLPGHRHNPSP